MNEKKVAFVNIEGIHGLPFPAANFSVLVRLHPKGENSPGKIIVLDQNEPKCQTTWPLIYHSENDEFVAITLNYTNNEYAKLLLPLKWFEVNKIVKETFPMRVTDHKAVENQIKIMMTVLIHRSENGECAFNAPQGQLLVKLQCNTNQTGDSYNNTSFSTPNNLQQFPQQQQVVYLNPGQPYMIPIPNTGQNQLLMPMQIPGQLLGQAPFAANPYPYTIQPLIYPSNDQRQEQDDKQQQVQNQIEQTNSITQKKQESKTTELNVKESKNSDGPIKSVQQNLQIDNEINHNSPEINQNIENVIQKSIKDDKNLQAADQNPNKSDKNAQDIEKNIDKSDKNTKKLRSTQNTKKEDQNTQIIDYFDRPFDQSTDQKDKISQPDYEKVEQILQDSSHQKTRSTKNTKKTDQTQQEQPVSDAIPVLQPLTVYIKTPEGKLKQMLLIPSTKEEPAKLIPASKKKI